MAKGVNKWIGIGNCCADPETKYLPSGGAVTNVTVACNDSYKDKNTGQVVDKTEFVRVVFFNRIAEIAGEYLRKGSKVYIEGSLRTRKWQDQSGQDRYTTEIVASEMQMLDGRNDSQGQQPTPQQQAQNPAQSYQPQAPQQPQGQYSQGRMNQPQGNGGYDFDDTIPGFD